MTVKLGVNIDHIATIREARKIREPDPVTAALVAELAGCMGITAHLREDKRHIQDRDVRLLRGMVTTKLNLKISPTAEMLQFATNVQPDMVTLVQENHQEITIEGGLNVAAKVDELAKYVMTLKNNDIAVSLFIDPETDQVKAAKKVGSTVAGTVGRELGKTLGSSFGKFGKTLGGNVGASLGRGLLETLFKLK